MRYFLTLVLAAKGSAVLILANFAEGLVVKSPVLGASFFSSTGAVANFFKG